MIIYVYPSEMYIRREKEGNWERAERLHEAAGGGSRRQRISGALAPPQGCETNKSFGGARTPTLAGPLIVVGVGDSVTLIKCGPFTSNSHIHRQTTVNNFQPSPYYEVRQPRTPPQHYKTYLNLGPSFSSPTPTFPSPSTLLATPYFLSGFLFSHIRRHLNPNANTPLTA
jgi:hypothetical protein